MEANIIFDNVTAYNVVKWDVRLGESFKVDLEDAPGPVRWFTDNDPVLKVAVGEGGTSANMTATEKGDCEIQIQYNNSSVKVLYVNVYDNIAVSLNTKASAPVLK